jgi:transcriptional regulator with XRE-family HTH domain
MQNAVKTNVPLSFAWVDVTSERCQGCGMTISPERTSRTMSDLIAEEIRVALTRQRTSQRQFAAKLGVSPAWLNYRLTGQQEIGVNDLHRIAHALGLSVYDLMPPPEVAATASVSAAKQLLSGWPIPPRRTRPKGRQDTPATRPNDRRPPGGPRRTSRLPRPEAA